MGFAALALVVVIDLSRTVVSYRTAQRHGSAALLSNAVHFGSDLLSTLAVIGGLVAARAGFPEGDSIAALFVAGLVVIAAARLIRRNVDVLMDRAPADAVAAAHAAIARLDPPVAVRRLRLRQAGGRTFADVVIGVSPSAAVGQGHAAADRVEDAVQRALPGSDVVVHVEPAASEAEIRERIRAAAMTVVARPRAPQPDAHRHRRRASRRRSTSSSPATFRSPRRTRSPRRSRTRSIAPRRR